MNKLLLVLLTICMVGAAYAQPVSFKYDNSLKFIENNDTLLQPFIGGFTAPQFNTIDLNGDNIKDLVVFDRDGNKVSTFLKQNGKFIYAPQYEDQFPKITNWMVLKDFNCDGLEDIFTEVDINFQPDKSRQIFTNGIRLIKNKGKVNGRFQWEQTQNQLYDTGVFGLPPGNIAFGNTDLSAIEDIDNDGDLDLLFFPLGKNVFSYYQNLSKELGFNCDSMILVFRDEAWGYMYYKVNEHGFVLNDSGIYARNYPLQKHAAHNGATILLFDKDGDGDKDLIYGDVGFNSLIYLENGKNLNSKNRDSCINQEINFPLNSIPVNMEVFPAAYLLDADNDGINDLVVAPNALSGGQNAAQILWYKNVGSNSNYQFSYQGNNFLLNQTIDLGGGAIPNFVDIDADGDNDLIVATHGNFVQTRNSNDRLVLYRNIGDSKNAVFSLADTNFLAINSSGAPILMMHPTFGDLNADGKPDLILGDINGDFHYFENTTVGSNISFNKVSNNYFSMYCGTYATPQLIDLNKDGLLDLVVGRKKGTLAYFQNSGTKTSPQFTASPTIDSLGKISVAPFVISNGDKFYFDGYSTPFVADIDTNGTYEVLVGNDEGNVYLFSGIEPNASKTAELVENVFADYDTQVNGKIMFGSRAAVAATDLTADRVPDVIIGNNRGGLRFYKTSLNGTIPVSETNGSKLFFNVYPNPAQSYISVQTKFGNTFSLNVYDCTGKLIIHNTVNGYLIRLDTEQLSNGLYYIELVEPKTGQKETKKVIISK